MFYSLSCAGANENDYATRQRDYSRCLGDIIRPDWKRVVTNWR